MTSQVNSADLPAAGTFAADPQALLNVADWLDRSAQDIADAVDAHMRAVGEFLGGDWLGQAAESHRDPWSEWHDGTRRIVGSFHTDSGLLRQASTEYDHIDQARATAVEQAGASLDLPPVV